VKHESRERELFKRAMDRIWQRSNEDAERVGQRFAADQDLLSSARLAGWKAPAERAAGAKRAVG
jgi:hypothetical protein